MLVRLNISVGPGGIAAVHPRSRSVADASCVHSAGGGPCAALVAGIPFRPEVVSSLGPLLRWPSLPWLGPLLQSPFARVCMESRSTTPDSCSVLRPWTFEIRSWPILQLTKQSVHPSPRIPNLALVSPRLKRAGRKCR